MCVLSFFFSHSFWIILFFYLLSMKHTKDIKKKKKKEMLSQSKSGHIHHKYLPLYRCIHLYFSCALPMSQGTVLIQTTFFKQLCPQPFLSTHFFVHCFGQDLCSTPYDTSKQCSRMGKAFIVFSLCFWKVSVVPAPIGHAFLPYSKTLSNSFCLNSSFQTQVRTLLLSCLLVHEVLLLPSLANFSIVEIIKFIY